MADGPGLLPALSGDLVPSLFLRRCVPGFTPLLGVLHGQAGSGCRCRVLAFVVAWTGAALRFVNDHWAG